MSETPREWVEMAWAAREAAHGALNQARRVRFERRKAVLLEADLPKSILHSNTNPNSNIMRYLKK